jgi:catechol 2,3-dioxygenase-like lactoylglutathione lyase family enzyme
MTTITGVRQAVLGVRDTHRSVDFYTDVLGMELVTFLDDMQMAFLSFAGHDHDLALIEVPDEHLVGGSRLTHATIEITGGPAQLHALRAVLEQRGVEVEQTADHVVTRSFSVIDLDGNRLEFSARVVPADEANRGLHDPRVVGDALRPHDLHLVA